jgi:hypothetical protein
MVRPGRSKWSNLYVGSLISNAVKSTIPDPTSDVLIANIPPDMFRMPESEIRDLSKADFITKAFAITQCTWLVVQSISRGVQGYSISQLELATLAFIFCAIVMHIFWWNKPFDVETRRVFARTASQGTGMPSPNIPSMEDLVMSDEKLLQKRVKDLPLDTFLALIYDMVDFEDYDKDLTSASQPLRLNLASIALYLTSTGFLAIHLAAWNWEFPSLVIRSLWRWSNLGALLTSLLPLVFNLLQKYFRFLPENAFFSYTIILMGLLSLLAYIVSRLVVLILTFYCLSSMPESAYDTLDWLAWVPHFS